MLTRWDPFRDMMSIRNTMDRLFDSYMGGSQDRWQSMAWDLALDVAENKDAYVVKASIPGINAEDIDITYNNNTLTIKGDVKEEQETEETQYHLRERRYGTFTRSITLPAGVESDKIEANYEGGVLTLRLPKAEEMKPRRIAISSQGSPQVIEAKARDGGGR